MKNAKQVTNARRRAKRSLVKRERVFRIDLQKIEDSHWSVIEAIENGTASLLGRRVRLHNGTVGSVARHQGDDDYSLLARGVEHRFNVSDVAYVIN